MRSERRSESLDLERDLPTTAEDIDAQNRCRSGPMAMEDYLRFLAMFGDTDPDNLRRRSGPTGDQPFRLL
jgi:hypothetical protein